MKANLFVALLGACAALTPWPKQAAGQTTVFERSQGRESFTIREMNQFYKSLDSSYNTISMHKIGAADGGAPLHVIYYCADGTTDPAQWKEEGKIIILINNNIHPGEPDGVDATAMMLRDAAEQKFKIPKNVKRGCPLVPRAGALGTKMHENAFRVRFFLNNFFLFVLPFSTVLV
jgi:hypothetical protein